MKWEAKRLILKAMITEDKEVRKIIDGHIHIEKGEYNLSWINEFVNSAMLKGLTEIWLLEHCYRFKEFIPMYGSVCDYSDYINSWFHRKAGIYSLDKYLNLVENVRNADFPITIKFGLEICYFKDCKDFVYKNTKDKGLDFLVGSVHFVDSFAFDHKAEFWKDIDVNQIYHRYFETSIDLAKSGIYNGIAHPDCIKLFGHTPTFSLLKYYDNLAIELAKQDMYAEQSSGIARRCDAELGMNKDMLIAMKKHNVNIVTVSDAHCPEDVGLYIKDLNDILSECKL